LTSARILVTGLINIETTLRIEPFPLAYNPVNYPFFAIDSTVSGVGYNIGARSAAEGFLTAEQLVRLE